MILIIPTLCTTDRNIEARESFLLFSSSMTSIAATIIPTTITLGEDDFHLLPLRQQRLTLSNASSTRFGIETDFVPVTVINWLNDRFTNDDLKNIIADFTTRDDVWTIDFLRGNAIFHLSIPLRTMKTCSV